MENKSIIYQCAKQKEYHLKESEDKFILRTKKGFLPSAVLESTTFIQPLMTNITSIASFPDSRVNVYRCYGGDAMREEIKKIIRNEQNDKIDFIGSAFQFDHSNQYQIYTGNLYIEFQPDLSEEACNKFLESMELIKKRDIHFKTHGYFCEPIILKQRNIFDFCNDLHSESVVSCCHPELVTELRPQKDHLLSFIEKSSLPNNWWLKQVEVYKAWKFTKGEHTRIAIIDDGIELNHPAFANKILYPRDMLTETALPMHNEFESHGTPCASIAASRSTYAPGIAPEAKLIPVRVTGLGSVLQSEAFYWAVKHGADVISCSWGPPDGVITDPNDNERWYPLPDHTRRAFEYAYNEGRNGKGCSIVFAGGNGNEPIQFDGYASAKEVIAVTSINHKHEKSFYGDYGFPLCCTFPSGDFIPSEDGNEKSHTGILVADRLDEKGYSKNDFFSFFTGTSASCPGVAGVIALMLSINPALTVNDIRDLLEKSCVKVGPAIEYDINGYSQSMGFGMLNAYKAVQNSIKTNHSFTKSVKMNNVKLNAVSLHIGINQVDPNYYGNYVRPLFGCHNDMNAMASFAQKLGYNTHLLKDSAARKGQILQKISSLGNSVKDGGTLFVSYSGHGAQLAENNFTGTAHDEKDGKDESWVCYDGFLLDDELYNVFASIKNRINIILFSDSCHSETMSKALPFNNQRINQRGLSRADVSAILANNNTNIEEVLSKAAKRSAGFKVSVLNLSAAKSTQFAMEENAKGVFTEETLFVYDKHKNDYDFNYTKLIELVYERVNRRFPEQEPNLTQSHFISDEFLTYKPFQIHQNESLHTNVGINHIQNYNESQLHSKEETKYAFDTNTLIVTMKNGVSRIEPNQGSRSKNQNAWDAAYEYVIKNQDSEIENVSPNIIANTYNDSKEFKSENKSVHDENGYLETYPNPEEYNNPEPFIWHLGNNFSQLRSAAESVFPELKAKQKFYNKEVVKIAHIDTGTLENHPTRPINLEPGKTFYLTKEEQDALDKDRIFYPAEQKGHGQGTISILAGNWVTAEHTDGKYEGFFGAIPYAKVLPIKISDTVVLLSGRLFVKAVDYAIDHGCDVITMSMAGLPKHRMAQAVDRAYEAGVVLVSAAGNCWSKGLKVLTPKKSLYPARYRRVIAAVGATYTKVPYRNNYNQKTKAAGNPYMQSCYGPGFVLDSSVAAYTPNIIWFSKNNSSIGGREYFVKDGGGTSSATPQIAAAAALYIQKHKKELEKLSKTDKWIKAEIVRQAIFKSCDKDNLYNRDYFGQGLLRASELLKDEYSPLNIGTVKPQPAASKKYIFNGLLNLYTNRSLISGESLSNSHTEVLKQMLMEELIQLVFIDPEMEQHQELDFENEQFDIAKYPEFIQDIINSSYSSEFLKRQLSQYLNRNAGMLSGFQMHDIQTKSGEIKVRTEYVRVKLNPLNSYSEGGGNNRMYVDEFEIDFSVNREIDAIGEHSVELTIEMNDLEDGEDFISGILIKREYESGEGLYEWVFPQGKTKTVQTKSIENSSIFYPNTYIISTDEGSRNFTKGLRKVLVKAFKWVIDKTVKSKMEKIRTGKTNKKFFIEQVLEQCGDQKYEIMIYDLRHEHTNSKKGWVNIEEMSEDLRDRVMNDINNDDLKVLLLLPGLFSTVEKGFDEFLDSKDNRKELMLRHSRYIIGLNMPTVIHGIQKNAEVLHERLKSLGLVHKKCTCIARSRGGIVARYLFELTWLNNKSNRKPVKDAPFVLDKLLMTGTPNQGTAIADFENWESLFNGLTNLAKLVSGTTTPIVQSITTAIKLIGMGITSLDGINDLEENSAVINQLNKIKANRNNYLVVTSNYEPSGLFKKLVDEGLFDRKIFNQEKNDSVTPCAGALFENPELEGFGLLPSHGKLDSLTNNTVNHFSYLNINKHPSLVENLIKQLQQN